MIHNKTRSISTKHEESGTRRERVKNTTMKILHSHKLGEWQVETITVILVIFGTILLVLFVRAARAGVSTQRL